MSKLSKYSTKETAQNLETAKAAVTNFMGGNSYTLNPLDTLRIVAASSIFGEPQYYRDGLEGNKTAVFMSQTDHAIFKDMFRHESAVDVDLWHLAVKH